MAANVLSGEVAFELVVHFVDHTVQGKRAPHVGYNARLLGA